MVTFGVWFLTSNRTRSEIEHQSVGSDQSRRLCMDLSLPQDLMSHPGNPSPLVSNDRFKTRRV